jgi:hypothetical protein
MKGIEGGLEFAFSAKGEAEQNVDAAIVWRDGEVRAGRLLCPLEAVGGEEVVYLLLLR